MFKPGDVVKHSKGGIYQIVGKSKFQLYGYYIECYVYKNYRDEMWTRPVVEMEDGRFVLHKPSDNTNWTHKIEQEVPLDFGYQLESENTPVEIVDILEDIVK